MSLQDFAIIRTHIESYALELQIREVDAFYFFALEVILDIPPDEIEEAITDNNYLVAQGERLGGHDRGIDVVYIDEDTEERPTIHLFNFKHTTKYEKATEYIASGEIDKILGFLNNLYNR